MTVALGICEPLLLRMGKSLRLLAVLLGTAAFSSYAGATTPERRATTPVPLNTDNLLVECMPSQGLPPMELPQCRVVSSGPLAGQGMAYQVQEWKDGPSHFGNRVQITVLLDMHSDDTWTVGHSFVAAGLAEAPYRLHVAGEGAGQATVWLPAQSLGSSGAREDVLVRRARPGARWVAIDTLGWHADLQRRLGTGVLAKMGYLVDYRTMTAVVPLARAGDSNAEPTGGEAYVRLSLRADRVTLVTYEVAGGRTRTTR